jgi:ribose transport system ATP-binding protein
LENEYILEVKGIVKSFTGTKALRGVDFSLRKGEIHALVGENGAGKSTLMNVIDGVFPPDAGEIYINGNKVEIKNPHEAQKFGIGFVHQEIALCPDVTVAENIFMSEINNSSHFRVDYNTLFKRAEEVVKPLGVSIKPDKIVGELSISAQQVVEIAKALSMQCKVLILDEPTAALTETEAEALFKIMQELKKQGIGIIYISHRMAEVFTQCDRVSILRDGAHMGTFEIKDVDPKTVVNKMVGREIGDMYPAKKGSDDAFNILFEIKNFSDNIRFKDVNFKLYEGEILGLAGLVGAGRSEVAEAVCGLRSKLSGEIFYKGKELKINSPRDSINNGIVYLTEDRKLEGLFLEMTIKQNVAAMNVEMVSKGGFVDRKKENEQGQSFIKLLGIRCIGPDQMTISLSGGNQQKVLISKLLTVQPKIIFMDEPTRGIDVGAKNEIHKLIRQLANEGVGIILISSELPEVVGMCDRVLVMREGNLCGTVKGKEINETQIIHLASGVCT